MKNDGNDDNGGEEGDYDGDQHSMFHPQALLTDSSTLHGKTITTMVSSTTNTGPVCLCGWPMTQCSTVDKD